MTYGEPGGNRSDSCGERVETLVPGDWQRLSRHSNPWRWIRARQSATRDSCSQQQFLVIDYDQRGYGLSDRPLQDYTIETWADDVAGLLDALDFPSAHIHGTSMGQVAATFAGKYPERARSVVINCAAARLGASGRLLFKNWIDIVDLDPAGTGSRILARWWRGKHYRGRSSTRRTVVALLIRFKRSSATATTSRSSSEAFGPCSRWTSRRGCRR